MKNSFLLFITALSILSLSKQGICQHLEIGGEAGMGMKIFYYKHLYEKGFNPGVSFTTGGFIQYNVSHRYTLRADISYERKGAFWTGYIPPYSYNNDPEYIRQTGYVRSEASLDYIVIPLQAKIYFGKKVRFFINAGPNVGFLLNARHTTKFTEHDYVIKENRTKQTRWFNVGITSGFGWEIPFNELLYLSIEIRNNLSITGTSKFSSSTNSKPNTTNLLVGFGYKLSK